MIHKRCKGCEAAALKVLTLLELIPAKHVREEWLRLALRVQIANVNPGVVCDGLVVNQKSLVLERRRAVRHLCYLVHRNIDGRVVNGVCRESGILSLVDNVLIVEHGRILWCIDDTNVGGGRANDGNGGGDLSLCSRARDRNSVASTSGEVLEYANLTEIRCGMHTADLTVRIIVQVHAHVVLCHSVTACLAHIRFLLVHQYMNVSLVVHVEVHTILLLKLQRHILLGRMGPVHLRHTQLLDRDVTVVLPDHTI
ncbi:hypothetical protein DQ04_00181000 [Trypanosoma grayi]|uniref:hypothetical protein n=1 Tax=Trypanosoma grayi TaxID=71804 RepID=UPI0004F48AC0|nr:hypothetical protein DQ04_00181000 [Trypanosoma grayi]KEG15107.1 hypothetical protein DQ04_00181000 [Trypanosoma grayi]